MRRRLSETQAERLAQDLADLAYLNEASLNDHFRCLYGVEPPARLRQPLLIQALAYRMQEKAMGGLKHSPLMPTLVQLLESRPTSGMPAMRRGRAQRRPALSAFAGPRRSAGGSPS